LEVKMVEEKVKKEENINLEKIITDYGPSKYEDVVLAMYWASHLKNTEEYRLKPVAEIIESALKDVVTKKVSLEDIKKAVEKDLQIKEQKEAGKKSSKKEKTKTEEK